MDAGEGKREAFLEEEKAMRIEHIAMYVNDLEKTREFFIKYLNAVSNDGYYESRVVGVEGNLIELTV